jgi:two-component sensor histidine kinase
VALLDERESVPMALVLNELVFNAVKHGGSEGNPSVRIVVSAEDDAARVRIVNAGNLPADFDYASQRGAGAGLGLVRSLLPRAGATLAIRNCVDGVEAVLRLQPPVIAVTRAQEIVDG